MKKIALLALFALTSTSAIAMDAPAKAKTCVGCHGVGGNSVVPNFPKLAGQHASYLEKQLKDFQQGYRRNPTMQAFAKGLSDQDIKDLAKYYSLQKEK